MNRRIHGTYSMRQKIGPFIRGLLDASPLVEIALSGLERDVAESERSAYIGRIAERGSTSHIFRAFQSGLGIGEQEALASAFERRYEASKLQYEKDLHGSESALSAPMLLELRRTYMRDSVAHAFILLRDGYVESERAQLDFASIIYADGLKEHADELMRVGSLRNCARQVLRHKGTENGNVA